MLRILPMIASAAAALVAAFLVRLSALDDLSKVVVVGVAALLALYLVEYLLAHRR